MKFILTIMLLAITSFAQNTTYKNGTECDCDSIDYSYYVNSDGDTEVWEIPYINGKKTGVEYWYLGGQLNRTAEFVNGLRHGNTTMYNNDTITMVSTYDNGFETKQVSYISNSTTTYEYNKKGQLVKEFKWNDKYSYSITEIYTYTKTTRTRNYFYNGNISSITVNKYNMTNGTNSSIKSGNIKVGEVISETHYNKYGDVSSNAVIDDGKILYYVCSTGKMVTYSHKCE